MVFSDREEESMSVRIDERRIRRTKEKDVVTVTETKDFRLTGPKRRHEGEYDTFPYGIRNINITECCCRKLTACERRTYSVSLVNRSVYLRLASKKHA